MELQDWMAHIERKRTELENAGHVMDDETLFNMPGHPYPKRNIKIQSYTFLVYMCGTHDVNLFNST